MPSPFPGMDPFIEGQDWKGFDLQFIGSLQASMAPKLHPAYVVLVEERVYLEKGAEPEQPYIRPDVTVAEAAGEGRSRGPVASATGAVAPIVVTLPIPEKVTERWLTIRRRDTRDVVAVIEVLSPGNKRSGSDGRQEYLAKRAGVLASQTHLVELDLLRGGLRLPTVTLLPEADYYAFISRGTTRPSAHVYPWRLRDALPVIPIPLLEGDADVAVDLQGIFLDTYERSGFQWSIDYTKPIAPPLSTADEAWVRELRIIRP
ncbi:MAG TPA: DUF4058 family protein [Candidatus Xenobia bacterium]